MQSLGRSQIVNAMGMLTDNNLSIDEVAFRLDFESERGFRKAFKRWSGKANLVLPLLQKFLGE